MKEQLGIAAVVTFDFWPFFTILGGVKESNDSVMARIIVEL